jgi:hypothetical protein
LACTVYSEIKIDNPFYPSLWASITLMHAIQDVSSFINSISSLIS